MNSYALCMRMSRLLRYIVDHSPESDSSVFDLVSPGELDHLLSPDVKCDSSYNQEEIPSQSGSSQEEPVLEPESDVKMILVRIVASLIITNAIYCWSTSFFPDGFAVLHAILCSWPAATSNEETFPRVFLVILEKDEYIFPEYGNEQMDSAKNNCANDREIKNSYTNLNKYISMKLF